MPCYADEYTLTGMYEKSNRNNPINKTYINNDNNEITFNGMMLSFNHL